MPWYIHILLAYFVTVFIETSILLIALSPEHKTMDKIFAGFWLTACTYPIVNIAIPCWIDPVNSRPAFLAVTETFAPLAECILFHFAYNQANRSRKYIVRDFCAIIVANVVSFLLGECLAWSGHPIL